MATFDRSITLNNQKMPHLKVNGSLTFYNLEIEKDVTTNGSVDGTLIRCQQFRVKGAVSANNLRCQDLEVNGSVCGSNIDCRHFKIDGPVKDSSNITVNGKAVIDGDCNVDGLTVKKTLNITGAAIGKKWNIGDKTEIIGYLQVDQSHFKNIELYSHDSALSNSTADNIVFRHCMPSNIPRTLRLGKGTVINGSITFEDGEGTIYIDSSSKIKGAIRGGNVVLIEDDRLAQVDQLETAYDMATKRNYSNHNGRITDEFSITVDKPNQETTPKANTNPDTIKPKTIPLPPLWLILGLSIACIASFALAAPLWLSISLGVLTSLSIGAKLVAELINNALTKTDTPAEQSQPNTPANTPANTPNNTPAPSPTAAGAPAAAEAAALPAKPKPHVRFSLNPDQAAKETAPKVASQAPLIPRKKKQGMVAG